MFQTVNDNNDSDTEGFNLFDSNYVKSISGATQISLFDSIPDVAVETKEIDTKIISILDNSTPPPKIKQNNFKITDFSLGEGTPKEKFERNLTAIKLLKKIENDNRPATAEEQEILSKYIGWGGLSACFDKDSKTDRLLRENLTQGEYEDAKDSVLSAYYTQPLVISEIYKFLERCGFKTGNILEPAMGVGNFFGMLPESMKDSNLYGVELDSVSGRIATLLYPNANIQVKGYEKTKFRDNFFDVAIGNVPFGSYMVADKRYDNLNLLIHDYFFAKTIDLVRPNGIIAFITSKGTMDKKKSDFREYIAQRCDLLGSVRLPNTAFKRNAGTSVTSDIIFLRKREYKNIDIPDWCASVPYLNGTVINHYFLQNTSQVLGNIEVIKNQFDKIDTTVTLTEDKDLKVLLSKAVKNVSTSDLSPVERGDDEEYICADADTENYSYTVFNGDIYYRENSLMKKCEFSDNDTRRIKALIEIRDVLHELLDQQLDENVDDKAIKTLQSTLTYKYELFVKSYGRIKSRANNMAFGEDASMPLLKSLEICDNEGNFERKADVFTKRTVRPFKEITHCDNTVDALAVSLTQYGEVNIDYISKLTEKSREDAINELKGRIYPNPQLIDSNGGYIYETADKYLSGNIREKLDIAKEAAAHNELFEQNVIALEKNIPAPLEATDINAAMGQVWIPVKYYNEFIWNLLRISNTYYKKPEIFYSEITDTFVIENKNFYWNYSVLENEFGTKRKNAFQIIDDTLNNKITKVYDTVEVKDEKTGDYKEKRVLNDKETRLAQDKQELIKSKFSDWIFDDPYRREFLVNLYNEKFNSVKVREYDGSYLNFPGMNPDFELYDYQKNAVAHSLYGGNVLLATCVGSGKTAMMCASIMEGKRIGKLSKALVVVPKHLTEQTGEEFLRFYPNANILVVTAKDFEKKKRKEFVAKIATSNYDAIIISHSQLSKIPLSPERQEKVINDEINIFRNALDNSYDEHGNRTFSTRSISQSLKSLEAKLEKLKNKLEDKADDTIIFEKLGIDKLVIDEAHYFKNLSFPTKMSNVAGVNNTNSEKAQDLFMKTQYLNEITNNNGIIFATGTPVSNSMTEIFTMQRYLQIDVLKKHGLVYFDAWAAMYGEVVQQFELAPEGKGFRLRERLARFHNLPELMQMFKQVTEIKDMNDLNLNLPELVTENITVEPTEIQKAYVDELSERATKVHNGEVKSNIDNMLKITLDGRKCGLDMRIIDFTLPNEYSTKVNVCINNVYRIYKETVADKLTQIVFCDLSTPNKEEPFTVYDYVRSTLIEKGVNENEIAFIHEYNTDFAKKKLFAQVRKGEIRILMGSTGKLGIGTNVQNKLVAIHDLDIPWRPSDLQQRLGRMHRQGNTCEKVYLYRYTTKATFDAYLYQILESKQKFISQIMNSKNPVRSADNIDEATLSFAEIKAICTGDTRIKEKLELDAEVAKLKVLKDNFKQTKFRLETEVNNSLPLEISNQSKLIEGISKDLQFLSENYERFLYKNIDEKTDDTDSLKNTTAEEFEIFINDTLYTKRKDAAEALNKAINNISAANIDSYDKNNIGSYAGLNISIILEKSMFDSSYRCRLKGEGASYFFDLSNSMLGSITRIENQVTKIPKFYAEQCKKLEKLEFDFANAKESLAKYTVFDREDELIKKSARLKELNQLLCG